MFFLGNLSRYGQIERVPVRDRYVSNGQPVLLTGVMDGWEAYPKWNLAYLNRHYGSHRLSADRLENGKARFIYPVLADYLDYVYTSEEANPYYAKTTLHLTTPMRHEYDASSFCSCWYRAYHESTGQPRRVELSCLYLGPRYVRSPLHRDIWGTSFWNALFEGRKLWVFVRPGQEHLVYDGQVDPFFPDFSRYPRYRELNPLVCIQEPGEIVYCPGNVWHAVWALEPSLALSENFINEENYRNVLAHFEGLGYQQALEKMKKITLFHLAGAGRQPETDLFTQASQ